MLTTFFLTATAAITGNNNDDDDNGIRDKRPHPQEISGNYWKSQSGN